MDEFKFATGIATDTVVAEHKQLNHLIDEIIAREDEIFDGDISDFATAQDYIPDLEVEEKRQKRLTLPNSPTMRGSKICQ